MSTTAKRKLIARFRKSEAVCEQVMTMISLLGNKTRFRILCTLAEGDFCVTDIVEIVQEGKISYVSQQLRMLTLAGYVDKYRDKKQVFYRLVDPKIRLMIDFLHDHYLPH